MEKSRRTEPWGTPSVYKCFGPKISLPNVTGRSHIQIQKAGFAMAAIYYK